ncbi:hypothetical protein L218DRAFT_946790 [Marasmius fiardii PR-910]|nr:hypothetical protein L218DRAFT_946790 [Marasmius fiardii PR-910]
MRDEGMYAHHALSPDQHQLLTSAIGELNRKAKMLKKIEVCSNLVAVLDTHDGDGPMDDPFSVIFYSFPHIVQLDIDVKDEHLQSLIIAMCSFPRLRHLTVKCFSVFIREEDPACTCTLPEDLKTFRFDVGLPHDQVKIDYYKAWLTSHPTREISHLSLGSENVTQVDSYSRICSNTLKTIHLNVDTTPFDGTYEEEPCDLPAFPRLESVTFESISYCGLQYIIPALGTLSSPYLRTIKLSLTLECFGSAELEEAKDPWVRLDTILAASQFARTTLEINTAHGVDLVCEDGVRGLLSGCSMDGRLMFTTS